MSDPLPPAAGTPDGEGDVPHRMTNYTHDRLTEWLFATMMVLWGAWLLVPQWTTFEGTQYAILREIASEPVWGAWSVAIGVVRMTALYVNGAHYRTPAVRAFCAWLGVCWWMTLGFIFLNTPIKNPAAGFAWYPAFAIFELVCVGRAARDAWHTRAFTTRRRPRVAT